MVKKKRINKTREQIIADLKSNKKFQAKMKFTKEQFYPALCNATTSIDDALQNLSIINNVLMEKFLGFMKEKTMKDINLYTNLDEKDPQFEGLSAMLKLFDDMCVYDAKEYIEGMRNEIQLFLNEESKKRPLKDLTVSWLDEIK